MDLLKKMFTRLTFTIVLLAAEVALFVVVLVRFVRYLPAIGVVSYALSILIVLVLVKKDEESAFKIIWIIAIMAIPILGGLLYLLFGSKAPTKNMRDRVEKEHAETAALMEQDCGTLQAVAERSERVCGCARGVLNASSYTIYDKTETKYYPFGELMYADMLKALQDAKEYIFMEYFIIDENSAMWKGILDILLKKVEEGVDVRLIYDDMGSLGLFSIRHVLKLREAKIKVITFNPFVPVLSVVMNNRDHRKIMVVDGHTAFNGGINLADEYINEDHRLGVWKDSGLRLKGKAVKSFTLMFLETWNAFCKAAERVGDLTPYLDTGEARANDGFVMPYGDSPLDDDPLGENVYIDILGRARRYVYIFTPYLIISEKMIHALQMAARRGVDIRLVTPGVPDKKIILRLTRSYYRYLLEAGVKIYEYTPGFLHAKSFVCDDDLAVVGTINLDYRSLYLHFECATLLYKTESVASLKQDAEKTMGESRRRTLENTRQNFWGNLFDAVLHVFAPLM